MCTRAYRLVTVKWAYDNATPEQAALVKELLSSKNGRDNVFVVLASVEHCPKTGQMMIYADLQPNITAEEVETAITRKLANADRLARV